MVSLSAKQAKSNRKTREAQDVASGNIHAWTLSKKNNGAVNVVQLFATNVMPSATKFRHITNRPQKHCM